MPDSRLPNSPYSDEYLRWISGGEYDTNPNWGLPPTEEQLEESRKKDTGLKRPLVAPAPSLTPVVRPPPVVSPPTPFAPPSSRPAPPPTHASWEYPQLYAGYLDSPRVSGGAPSESEAAGANDVGLAGLGALQDALNRMYHTADYGRIPGFEGLESSSSARINELLNPPAVFSDADRISAELGASRGVAGSPSSRAVTLKLSDDERLKRIALGQQLLSSAAGRHGVPPTLDPTNFVITPKDRAQLDLKRAELELQRYIAQLRGPSHMPSYGGSGGSPHGGSYTPNDLGSVFDQYARDLGAIPTKPGWASASSRTIYGDPDWTGIGYPEAPGEGTGENYPSLPPWIPPDMGWMYE